MIERRDPRLSCRAGNLSLNAQLHNTSPGTFSTWESCGNEELGVESGHHPAPAIRLGQVISSKASGRGHSLTLLALKMEEGSVRQGMGKARQQILPESTLGRHLIFRRVRPGVDPDEGSRSGWRASHTPRIVGGMSRHYLPASSEKS